MKRIKCCTLLFNSDAKEQRIKVLADGRQIYTISWAVFGLMSALVLIVGSTKLMAETGASVQAPFAQSGAVGGGGGGGGGFGGGAFSLTGQAGGESSGGGGGFGSSGRAGGGGVFVERLQHVIGPSPQREQVPWVGVAVSEASEALISQLGLPPGVGLEVTYVASNSPAAKAGLEKNDILVRFEDQSLVLPAQFRKLVQVRKEGDTVKLLFYRHGKEQKTTITLAKTGNQFSEVDDFQDRFRKFNELIDGNAKTFGRSIKIDQKNIQEQVRRSMEQAARAYEQALRTFTNSKVNFDAAAKEFRRLSSSGVVLDNDAAVTVRTTGNSAKSLVKADESGTIVIVANPELRLTAHDKAGKLIFDGDIQTSDQRSKVPSDLWQKVEPLVRKMGEGSKAGLETELEQPDQEQ